MSLSASLAFSDDILSEPAVPEEAAKEPSPSKQRHQNRQQSSSSSPVNRQKLSPELRRQRQAQLGQTFSSTEAGAKPAGKGKRVDLYVNEQGYPQERAVPSGETSGSRAQQTENRRPRRQEGDNASAGTRFDRSHNRPIRPGQSPRENYVVRSDAGDSGAQQQELPPSRFGSRTHALASSTSGQVQTGGSRGPSRQGRFPARNAGASGRPGGAYPSTARPPRPPRRSVPRTLTASGRQLSAPPAQVVASSGSYNMAELFSPSSSSPVQPPVKNALQAKGALQRAKELNLDAGKIQKIATGDWESYIAPIFMKQQQSGKKSPTGITTQVALGIHRQAKEAIVRNSSMSLDAKLEVLRKIESTV